MAKDIYTVELPDLGYVELSEAAGSEETILQMAISCLWRSS